MILLSAIILESTFHLNQSTLLGRFPHGSEASEAVPRCRQRVASVSSDNQHSGSIKRSLARPVVEGHLEENREGGKLFLCRLQYDALASSSDEQ